MDVPAETSAQLIQRRHTLGKSHGFEHLAGVEQSEVEGMRVTLRTRDADATVRALVHSSFP